ncbi:MAG: 6-pyruvoyl tetrahydropterin synthase [Syntrophorhabdaceae bacterium PtaU1.Bin034]|jgi:6-pyruvoyltetrahydropterin/6-carboxytetrahydropterin synthase|nr:MAG: 6-pyruvoyl tetrahydropterin synthase [Syntrophorhabdaceae bacterium PtaU1.Bin034]
MYTVAVERDFIARHFLFGGDWGDENNPHSHHYRIEVQLKGRSLDEHGYLVDIGEIEKVLDQILNHYRDRMLNSMSDFSGLNPSIEQFARIFCEDFANRVSHGILSSIRVKIWENDIAWASYTREL